MSEQLETPIINPGLTRTVWARTRAYMESLEGGAPPKTWEALDHAWNHPERQQPEDESTRRGLQNAIAYATLTDESFALIRRHAAGRRTVDVGAGRGHLVRVLKANGLDAIGVDLGAVGEHIEAPGSGIKEEEATAWLDRHRNDDDLLLLCWPPMWRIKGIDLGLETARRIAPGQKLCYIGERDDGWTGTRHFHDHVRQAFVVVGQALAAPLTGSWKSDWAIMLERRT